MAYEAYLESVYDLESTIIGKPTGPGSDKDSSRAPYYAALYRILCPPLIWLHIDCSSYDSRNIPQRNLRLFEDLLGGAGYLQRHYTSTSQAIIAELTLFRALYVGSDYSY